MSLENLESTVEENVKIAEDKTENNEIEMEQVKGRLEAIEQAMQELSEDQEVARTVEKNREQAEQDKERVKKERDQIESDLETIEQQMSELSEINEESAQTLRMLREFGEPNSEGEQLVETRRTQLGEMQQRIMDMRNRLKN